MKTIMQSRLIRSPGITAAGRILLGLMLVAEIATCVHAQGQIASGTISGSGSGPYTYNLMFSNAPSATSPVGSVWYAWIPGQFYLPGTPTSASAPAGWTANIALNSIQFTANAPAGYIMPGSSLTGFSYQAAFSPAQLAAAPNSGDSVAYSAGLFSDAGDTFTVTAQSANVPPSVAITAPTNGATFAAPWSGEILVTVSDSDATVNKVDFFASGTLLGTVTNPPANTSFAVTNLAAGNYTLTAVATDSFGLTNTPVGAGINVVTPVAIVLSSAQRLSATSFQFNYTANTGLSYIVLRSNGLPGLSPISTNTATSSTVNFLDNSATGALNFYRVQLVPNP
jgi:hypothetical protein